MQTLLIIILTLCLAGCYSESNKHETSYWESMAGTWEMVGDDEFYLVIDNEGNGQVYDYLGDIVDNGSNCYFHFELTIYPAENDWRIEIGSVTKVFDIEFVDGNMILSRASGYTEEYAPSNLLVSDFEPICVRTS